MCVCVIPMRVVDEDENIKVIRNTSECVCYTKENNTLANEEENIKMIRNTPNQKLINKRKHFIKEGEHDLYKTSLKVHIEVRMNQVQT